jgi:hypothetical protein
MTEEVDYCGCCGNEIDGADAHWCLRCVQHVAHYVPANAWEQTYFALNGIDCPFQVGGAA